MSLRLSFFPSEKLVPAVSRLVADFCTLVLSDQELTMRYLMAAQELAENVTKYANGSAVGLGLEFARNDSGYVMRIQATNTADPHQLEEVRSRLEAVKTAENPEALYDKLILETAGIEGVSGLGLARIRAEGNLHVDYHIEGDQLTITAETKPNGSHP